MNMGGDTATANWSLITFTVPGNDADRAGILLDDGRIVVPAVLASYAGLIAALRDWDRVSAALREAELANLPAIPDARLVAPVRYPNKLLMVGANYVDHIKEMGDTDVPLDIPPYIFFLPPTTTLVGPEAIVRIPADEAANIDWEAELAIVIGRRAKDVAPEDALDYVAGYSAFNDVTARGYLRRKKSLAPPFQFDWARAKGLDGFCPMGPVTPAWMVDDPQALSVRCTINGTVRQNGNTSTMIVGVREVIAEASRNWTLEPGDVIATGTPAGVGAVKGTFLKDGDTMLVEVGNFAPLKNSVAAM